MSELFSKLGLDWKLLLAQAVNFLVLLTVLYLAAYKPLLKVLKSRRDRIEEGLTKAEEADRRLLEANEMAKEKMKAAEAESLKTLQATENKAKKLEAELLAEAHEKESSIIQNAERVAKTKGEEESARVRAEAKGLIRMALEKAVGLKPQAIDESMINEAVEAMKRS
jgi:F-type H+-transporting ATPase subunit b